MGKWIYIHNVVFKVPKQVSKPAIPLAEIQF